MSEAYETLRGRTNFKLRAFARHDKNNAKSFRERARQRSVHQVRSGTAPESPGSVPGPARGDFWMVPRRFWPAPDAPGSPKIDPGALFWHPRPVPSAFPNQFRAPTAAQDQFGIDFGSIFGDFRSFFVEFRSSCLRRMHKIGLSKRSRVILTARLGSCVVQSLRIARTYFDMTFGHYMFSLFSLRTYKST